MTWGIEVSSGFSIIHAIHPMNTPRTLILALLATGIACAQDTPAPAPAEPAQTEMQKWIATTDEQWQAVLKRDVTDVQATELEKLKQQYVAALEAAVTKFSAAGDLDGVVALRNEEKRFAGTNLFPEQDEATDAATVKQIRAAVRAQIAKVEKDNAARTKALHAKYDAFLGDAQTRLTKVQRIEDALLVKAKREEVAKAWLAGIPAAPPPVNSGAQPKPPSVATAEPPKVLPAVNLQPGKLGGVRIADATKDRPFENSLGMRFVPVPITGGPTSGQRVLFSIWETRVQDFEVFVKETNHEWPKPPAGQGPTHPATFVSWDDAQAFCVWLTEHERKASRLGTAESYRLPLDHEWSCLVGIGKEEDPAKAPAEKSGKMSNVFPWGNGPKPPGFGNYKGVETTKGQKARPGFHLDEFVEPAPVGSFPPDRNGCFEVTGNVWEWCEELYSPNEQKRFVRGGGAGTSDLKRLCSDRWPFAANSRNIERGFRVVLSAVRPSR